MMITRILSLLFLMLMTTVLRAQNDSLAQFSLLTCSPGTEVYSLYGHTALRVRVPQTGMDAVVNYGLFSFDTPYFIWLFTLGQTDYEMGIIPFKYFQMEYEERGSSVTEQVLNLNEAEKQKLMHLLEQNALPANRVYRYNYFYNNCTTRARDIVVEAIGGEVKFPSVAPRSLRSIVHEYTRCYPWAQLGNDLLLGAEADKPVEASLQMFAPEYLERYAQQAVIVDHAGRQRPFVLSRSVIIPLRTAAPQASPFTPFVVALIVALIVFAIYIKEWRSRRISKWLDVFVYTTQFLMGCVVAILFFFSEHPTVGSNWQILVLNPLPILLFVMWMIRPLRPYQKYWHGVNVALIVVFYAILTLNIQQIDKVIVLLAFIILIRSVMHLLWPNQSIRQNIEI